MFSRVLRIILLTILSAASISPALANAFHSCDHSHIEHTDGHDDAPGVHQPSDASDDSQASSHDACDCASHRTGCCHVNPLALRTEGLSLNSQKDLGLGYGDSRRHMPNGPDLAGPFQPPRA